MQPHFRGCWSICNEVEQQGVSKSENLTILWWLRIACENIGSYILVLAQGASLHMIN